MDVARQAEARQLVQRGQATPCVALAASLVWSRRCKFRISRPNFSSLTQQHAYRGFGPVISPGCVCGEPSMFCHPHYGLCPGVALVWLCLSNSRELSSRVVSKAFSSSDDSRCSNASSSNGCCRVCILT